MRLIALSLPFVVLAGVEGVLRLCGFGGYLYLFAEVGPASEGMVVRANTDWPRQFFSGAAGEVGTCQESAFVVPKPPHTVRIFLVGASFAKGWPHTPGLTAAAFLERKLQQAWPDRRVEVINLGTTAVASFPVVRMTAEALRYEPDLIIVCTAHNEFYGACGVASVHAGGSSTMIHLSHAVRKLAIVQVVSGFSRPRAVCHQEDRDALIERMAAEDQIAPNDALGQSRTCPRI